MRIFPILTATVVTFALYFVIFARDEMIAFATGEPVVMVEEVIPEKIAVEDRPAISILALKSTAQDVDSGIILRGRTEASRFLDVRAEVTGLVVSQSQPKGSIVEQGQLLCKLDSGTRQAALAEAKARLAEAAINENTASTLADRGFGSATAVTARRAALEAAQAGVDRAAKEIERLSISAPFAGLLEINTAEIGSLLQPGGVCGRIIQLDPIKLVGFVPEQDIQKLKLGAQAGARLIDGTTVTGQVTFLSSSADQTTRTFRVEVEVANKDGNIRDGTTAEIFIAFAGQRAHLLPQSALTLDDSGTLGIRVVENGAAKFLSVTIVRDTANGVWLSGLPESIDVIVVGQEYVTDGRLVTVTYREDAE